MWLGLVIAIINRFFNLIYILILARIIMTWIRVPLNKYTRLVVRFIFDVTEPILGLFRGILPLLNVGSMGIDLSPIIAFMVLELLHRLIISLLQYLAF